MFSEQKPLIHNVLFKTQDPNQSDGGTQSVFRYFQKFSKATFSVPRAIQRMPSKMAN